MSTGGPAFDLAGGACTVGAPSIAVFAIGWEPSTFAPWDGRTTGTARVVSHPCKERKDGAASVAFVSDKRKRPGQPSGLPGITRGSDRNLHPDIYELRTNAWSEFWHSGRVL